MNGQPACAGDFKVVREDGIKLTYIMVACGILGQTEATEAGCSRGQSSLS